MISFEQFLTQRWYEQNAVSLYATAEGGGAGTSNTTPGRFFGQFFGEYFGDFFGTI